VPHKNFVVQLKKSNLLKTHKAQVCTYTAYSKGCIVHICKCRIIVVKYSDMKDKGAAVVFPEAKYGGTADYK
jgi:hypothetical protein